MIHNSFSQIEYSNALHVVIGSFDGVHFGHKKLITQTIQIAKKNKEKSLIFSFEPLPKEFFLKENFAGRLLPSNIKRKMLENFNADYTIIADFEIIKDCSEKQLVEILLAKCKHIYLYAGKDFRMGCIDGDCYSKSDITKIIHPEFMINQNICRSSNIRKLIEKGEIEDANILLNYEYCIYSHTIDGNKFGRTINFPTINVIPNNQILPQNGVYFGEVNIFNSLYPAALYVGNKPTFQGLQQRIECHIVYDFPYAELKRDIEVEIIFIKKIAEEKCFNSIDKLSKMLYNYKQECLNLANKRY